MEVSQAVLRELHGLHQQMAELTRRRDRGPKQIAAHETNVKRLESALADAQQKVKQARMGLDQKQLDLKSSEAKIADWRRKLNACETNKEYQTLLEQIAAAEMATSVLEDEILEGLDRIEQLDVAAGEAGKQLEAARAEQEKVKKRVSDELVVVNEDIARLSERLAAAEVKIPAPLRHDYERVVHAKGADALSPVEDGVCTGCGQQITLNALNEMNMGRTGFCRACGRLLYLPEGA
jgi:predicted  nucleic acid-binding Zn-ribbon protein